MTDASSSYQDSLPVSSDAMLEHLEKFGALYEFYQHIPLRTVDDAKTVQGAIIPDAPRHLHLKNFYLRNKKKRNFLVVLEQDRVVDLNALGTAIGAGKVSFGSADRLFENLGVRPGAVSPLAMINGVAQGVSLYMDAALKDATVVNMHPLVNDRTVAMSPDDLLSVLAHWGCDVHWIDV